MSRLKEIFSKISSRILAKKKFILIAVVFFVFLLYAASFASPAQAAGTCTCAPDASSNPNATSSQPDESSCSSYCGGSYKYTEEAAEPEAKPAEEAPEAEPDEHGLIVRFLGWVIEALVFFLGAVLLLEVKILITIAQYNGFLSSTAVTNGWVIVRDLCNMFFIVVLLVIAIATILKIEMYHYKKLLGRLIIMAVLINFSKLICGLVIDFSQVLMMTFVNGFSAAAGGNFIQALKLEEIMNVKPEPGVPVSDWAILGAFLWRF